MKYYLIAGEASGDLHGANLMRGLQACDAEAQFRFWGGDRMTEVGGVQHRVRDYRETSFFGIVGVLRNLKTIFRQLAQCQEDVLRYAPDVLILIDYPGFNMRMAQFAHEHGIRTFYYIAPKVWAWREHRVRKIRRYVDRLYIIFPFEQEYFPKQGITPIFRGNPLLDALHERGMQMPSSEEFRRANGLNDRPIIALVAGSRRGEIVANLPLMCAVAAEFPEYQFVVTGVSWLDAALYDKYMCGNNVTRVSDQTYATLHHAVAAVVTSGTATLETALMHIPEVVVYRTVWWQVWLRPYVLKVPFISLVNLNLRRKCVEEVIQSNADPQHIVEELRRIIPGGSERERMMRDYDELDCIMGGTGASLRFARDMYEALHNKQE
jgi:lipid-A-disaccharide synthase